MRQALSSGEIFADAVALALAPVTGRCVCQPLTLMFRLRHAPADLIRPYERWVLQASPPLALKECSSPERR
jgi:hypothetical protein